MADRDAILEGLGMTADAAPSGDAQVAAIRAGLGQTEPEYRGDETDPDDPELDDDNDDEGEEDDERNGVQTEGRKAKTDDAKEAETDIQAQITALRAELDAAKAEAAKGNSLREMMNADPARFAQALLGSMDAKGRQAVLGAYGTQGAQEALSALERKYVELGIEPDTITPAERFLFEQHDTITTMPERLQNLASALDAELDTVYSLHEYQEAVLAQMAAALKLPVPDYNAYRQARATGKSAKDAVAETYGKAVEAAVAKQERPRPRTLDGNNGGGSVKAPGPNASFEELVRYQWATGTKGRF